MSPECLKLIEDCELKYKLRTEAQKVTSSDRPKPAKIDDKSEQEEETTMTTDATVSTCND